MSHKQAKRLRKILKEFQVAGGVTSTTEYIDRVVRSAYMSTGKIGADGKAIMALVPIVQRTLKPGCDRHFLKQLRRG